MLTCRRRRETSRFHGAAAAGVTGTDLSVLKNFLCYKAMMGDPVKRQRKEIAERAILAAAAREWVKVHKAFEVEIDAAILIAAASGVDSVELMLPVAEVLHAKALEGDVVAIKEVFDRVSGKVAQELQVDRIGLDDLEAALEEISARRRLGVQPVRAVLEEIDVTPEGT